MASHQTFSPNGSGGSEVNVHVPGRDLRDYLELVVRHWYVLALTVALALGGGMWALYTAPDTFTAEVLLQQRRERSPLESLQLGVGPDVSPEAVRSQINVLQSRAVLEDVVDTLGLRVRIAGSDVIRGTFLGQVDVLANAPEGRYQLGSNLGGEVELRDRDGEKLLLSAGPDDVIRGLGLYLEVLNPDSLVGRPLDIQVTQKEQAIDDLRGTLELSQVRGTTMIYVRYSSPDPALAAAVVNSLAGSYQAYGRRNAKETATRRRAFLGDQLAEVTDSLRSAQADFQSYQESSSTIDPRLEGENLSERLLDAERDLQQLEFEEELLSDVLVSMGNRDGLAPGFERVLALGDQLVPGGAEIYRRLRDYESERRQLTANRFGATEGAAQVQTLDSLIAAASSELRTVSEQALSVVQDRQGAAEARVDRLNLQVGALPGRATAFNSLQQRVEAVQKTYDLLVEKYYEAQVAEAVEEGEVEVVDYAAVPEIPDPRRAVAKLGLSGLLGLLLGIGLIFAGEQLAVSVRDADDVRRATSLDVVGLIPTLDGSAKKSGLVVDPTDVRGSESFRMLRTVLDYARQDADRHCIAITSAEPGAGKSTVALNLAAAQGRQGRRVLLVDGDLRRPTIHSALELARGPGLSDILMGRVQRSDVTKAFHALGAKLDIVTCGVPVDNPAELFGHARFTTFLQEASREYDIVIIDLPPVLAVSESILVSTLADGVAMVARSNRTSRFALGQAVEQLRRLGTPLLGVVLNEAPVGGVLSKYRGYYDYEYREADKKQIADRVELEV